MAPTPAQGASAPGRADGPRPGALSALLQDLVRPEGAVASDWGDALRPGAVIGRFELVREVGRGGFGVVYEARDRALGRTVAFKAIRATGDGGVADERAQREAEAAARLSHPNIVTLHDVGTCEHGPFLVLELLRGRTLAERLELGPVAVREAIRIALDVAKGLAHAHANGVVHRDLTPGNLFLCDDGQVKILDLGMAHAFGTRKLEGGTPAYMAPEQREGAPEDERSDVYALGVLLYRMLSGSLPFGDSSRRPLLPGRPAPALQVAEAPAAGELVRRMLERDPVKRPRDAGVVRDALTSIQQELDRTPSAGAARPVRRRRGRASMLAAAMGIVVVVGAAVAFLVAQHGIARRPARPPPSVAVLPFADMSPQKDQEYFADGLSEEILNALAHVDGLHVVGRTSSFAFKGAGDDLRSIGAKLNVGTVLEGSVRKAGDRVRITAQLINLADGFHLWSETYDRRLTDIFAVQDEIARAVAGALQVKLLPGAAKPARARPTVNPDAYTQYLLGKQWYAQFTKESHRRAAEAFERAVAIDPSYAAAWATLAIQYFNGAGDLPPDEARKQYEQARAAADKAVALDPTLGEGWGARGTLRAYVDWDWAGAMADLDRAVALSPSDAASIRRRALVLQTLGRFSEARDEARKAADLDPLFPANWLALGSVFASLGDRREARRMLERAREIAPGYAGVDSMFALLTLVDGDPARALQEFQGVRDEAERLMGIAIAQHSLGHAREAQQALDALAARYGAAKPGIVAVVYAWRGDRDRAFAWLDRAYAQHGEWMAKLKEDWVFAPKLRDDPRYEQLLRRVNLPVP